MNINSLLYLMLSFLFIGCSPTFYQPNNINTPMLKEEKQFRIGGSFGNSNNLNLEIAVAPINHLGLIGTFSTFNPDKNEEGEGGNGKINEGGIGYFNNFYKNFIIDAYGIYGKGNVKNYFINRSIQNMSKLNANIERFGLQGSIGYSSKYFEINQSFRYLKLNYYDIKGNLVWATLNQIDLLNNNRNNWLFESAITIRAGIDPIKFQYQVVKSTNLTKHDFPLNSINISLGLVSNMQFRKKIK